MVGRMRPRLKNVTVCAVDCVSPDLAARALDRCVAACEFGDAVLFSDSPVAGSFRFQQIEKIDSFDAYSRFCLRDMPSLIQAPYVLVIQWDGFVANPSVWDDTFLTYDYIGAPWHPDGMVGNGGFSLRSRRLLDALVDVPLLPDRPEDWLIGRYARAALEMQHRVRFSPTTVASRFSYEAIPVRHPTFGFHGLFNMHRHLEDAELLDFVSRLNDSEQVSWRFLALIGNCIEEGKPALAVRLYEFPRRAKNPARIKAQMSQGPLPPGKVSFYVDLVEKMWAEQASAGS